MGLMNSYLLKTSDASDFLASLRKAKAPDKLTRKFIQDLGYKSSNHRMWIGVLRGLGFIDEDGSPTERYYHYLDESMSGQVLAEAIEDAYDDLFAIDKSAQDLTVPELKGKFKTLTQGTKSDNVVGLMATTFSTLADLADWEEVDDGEEDYDDGYEYPSIAEDLTETLTSAADKERTGTDMSLHYNIQIILPSTADVRVYDAIFMSLKRHLR